MPHRTIDDATRRLVRDLRGLATSAEVAADLGIPAAHVRQIWARGEWNGERIANLNKARSDRKRMRVYEVPPEPVVTEGEGVAYDDLKWSQCQWEIGRDPEGNRRYCGDPRCGGRKLREMYCARHGAMAVEPDSGIHSISRVISSGYRHIGGAVGINRMRALDEFMSEAA